MTASFPVMLLVSIGVFAAVYAFVLEVRRGVKTDRLLEWLKRERKAEWDGLSRVERLLTVRAVEILRRGVLADDADFHARYQMTRHGTRFAIAMSMASVAIALVLVATTWLGWEW
jgi:hypothetical protein